MASAHHVIFIFGRLRCGAYCCPTTAQTPAPRKSAINSTITKKPHDHEATSHDDASRLYRQTYKNRLKKVARIRSIHHGCRSCEPAQVSPPSAFSVCYLPNWGILSISVTNPTIRKKARLGRRRRYRGDIHRSPRASDYLQQGWNKDYHHIPLR